MGIKCGRFNTKPRDRLRRTFPKWPILCSVRNKTLTQSNCGRCLLQLNGDNFYRPNAGHITQQTVRALKECTALTQLGKLALWTSDTSCVGWLRGTVVECRSHRRTFPVLRSTCSWWVTTYVRKPFAESPPTRPTQPFILLGSINE